LTAILKIAREYIADQFTKNKLTTKISMKNHIACRRDCIPQESVENDRV
jgi:hypothetical protein